MRMRNGDGWKGKLAGAARESRYVPTGALSISSRPALRRKVQNGRMITRKTISAAAIPGISLSMRTALPESGRSPFASFLP